MAAYRRYPTRPVAAPMSPMRTQRATLLAPAVARHLRYTRLFPGRYPMLCVSASRLRSAAEYRRDTPVCFRSRSSSWADRRDARGETLENVKKCPCEAC